MSTAPPGANGTIIRIGFAGQAWHHALVEKAAVSATIAADGT
jgi:hypothetical protein